MQTITLTTANQEFSRLIKEVGHGKGFLITRRGQPVAKLVPHTVDKSEDPDWAADYQQMIERLEKGASLGGLRVKREELYER